MDARKRKSLTAKGWKFGTAADFLSLTPEESRFIELKMALGASVKAERLRQNLTQTDLAKLIGSSQSRVAKMEGVDPAATVDLLLKALLAMGVTRRQLARLIA
jgi:hypothetical protein